MQNHPIILFDGVCNFCSSTVTFVAKQDRKRLFHFAAFQSEAGQMLVKKYNLPESFSSFFLIQNDKAYSKSNAALILYNQLPWYWKWTQIFWIVPRFIRDAVYSFFAANRYKWFGKKETCMVPTPELRSRFMY